MTAPPESAGARHAPPAGDYLDRVKALAPRIAASVEQIERERRLPQPLVDAMIEAGLFRLLLPRPLDGAEVEPLTFMQVIEEIAKLDASTAWCLCQTGVAAMVAASLPAEAAWQIFGRDRRAVLAWGAGPGGRAVAVQGGYRVTGNWLFASGGHHATWLGGHCLVHEPDGTPRRTPDGAPVVRTMLFPAASAAMDDNWHVIGLKGTGSDAYSVTEIFVPDAHSVARDDPAERRHATPLYYLRTNNMFSCGFASLALGLARSMLGSFVALAMEKSPRGAKQTMRDNAVVQADIGELEARLRGARMYIRGTVADIWQSGERSSELTLDERMAIRLAATRALQEARAVADAAYHAAGATAIFAGNPFERRFRDMNAVAQQVQARRSHFETVGRFMLGLDVDTTFL